MKLLFCPNCQDVFKLGPKERTCFCGKTAGRYLDVIDAEIRHGIPLGFNNTSLAAAIRTVASVEYPPDAAGIRFEAFVITEPCKSIIRRK